VFYIYCMQMSVFVCCSCCCAEELKKAVSSLKLSGDTVNNDDVFKIIISSLECESKMYILCINNFCVIW